MNKAKLDKAVAAYCKKFRLSKPAPWAYPGDLIFEPGSGHLFICGDAPKDVAELRRRSVSFKKVDVEALRKFLLNEYR